MEQQKWSLTEQLWSSMIKFIITWYAINLVFFIVFLGIKLIERKKEKREEMKKDYREY